LYGLFNSAKLGVKKPGIIGRLVRKFDENDEMHLSLIVAIAFGVLSTICLACQIPFTMLSIKRNGASWTACVIFCLGLINTV